MYVITENTIGEAWLKAMSLVLHNSALLTDDKGMIREILSLSIHIESPFSSDNILEHYASKKMISDMEQNFRNHNAISGWNYSYAQRLYNYQGINQIEKVIDTLQSNIVSKSATISLLDVIGDNFHKPCLTAIDFKVRNNKLLITGFFRSQDIGKKFYADALELLHIGKLVANQLSLSSLEIIHFISSAHIYEQDVPQILNVLEKANFLDQ